MPIPWFQYDLDLLIFTWVYVVGIFADIAGRKEMTVGRKVKVFCTFGRLPSFYCLSFEIRHLFFPLG